jgi:hypothetical protein
VSRLLAWAWKNVNIESAPKLDFKFAIKTDKKQFASEIIEAALIHYLAGQYSRTTSKGKRLVSWVDAVKVNHFACGKDLQAMRDINRKVTSIWAKSTNRDLIYKRTHAELLESTLDINNEVTAISLWTLLE